MTEKMLKEMEVAFSLITKIGLLVKAEVLNPIDGVVLATNTIKKNISLTGDALDTCLNSIGYLIGKVETELPDYLIEGITSVDDLTNGKLDMLNIKVIDIRSIGSIEGLEDILGTPKYRQQVKRAPIKEASDDMNHQEKELWQRVEICNPLFTNMMVRESGEQTVEDDFSTPFIPELMGKTAIVIGIEKDKRYICGDCERPHQADLEIFFPHNEQKFFINSDFVKPIESHES